MLRERFALSRTSPTAHIALAVVVASLVALPAGSAIARGHGGSIERRHGGNSSAVAINTTDHSLVFKLTFAILTVTGDVVDNLNIADAYADCHECQTVAISIQTLLVDSTASTVAPINEASARNQNCVQCDTLAIAYQFVVAGGTNLTFTPEGRREVAYIRRQLEMLRQEARRGMTGAQIAAAVAALMKQYADILNTQLVPAGQPRARGGGAGASGATPPARVISSTAANPGASTTTGPTTSPTSTTPPTAMSGGTTTTSSSTPSTTTTGTSAGPTGTTTTPSGTTTTPSGTATTRSATTTSPSEATTTTSSSTPSTTTP